jgi:DMSO/TMAO reductase YedYZ molybdopterin-dependent catalytic subunit
MDQKISTKLLISAVAILAFVVIFLIRQSEKKDSELIIQQKTQATQLGGVEVREYNGEKLSSIGDVVDQGIKGVQNIDIKNYNLQITGLVDQPKKFAYDQVLQLPKYKKVVDLNCVEGWNAKILWEGVQVKDLIDSAGLQAEANTIIFYAQDGYTTSLPLDYIRNNSILLAYKMNDVILSPAKGFPFQLVAEQKWGYKWIKWVTKIELSNDPNYKGYWESNGYNNNGDLNGSKLAP